MLRSAVLRLTLSYLAIIMALSLGFSFWIYHISSEELEHDLRRPAIEQLTPGGYLDFDLFRESRLSENQLRLRESFVLLNLGVLIFGGLASYALAKRTLRPIEQTLDTQSRFVADASHELRTPLTAMETEIEVALRNKNLGKNESKELLKSNLEEVIKLKYLSNNLLKLARQDNGDELDFDAVDLSKVANEAIDRLSSIAQSKRITIKSDLQKSLVNGDQSLLTELAIVLIDNAIKYSKAGKTISVKTFARNHRSQLWVEDEGIGIHANELSHIFDRFYRTDISRTKAAPGGHGLGLSIAKNIVEQHKGFINVKSTFGKGSVFKVSIPALKT